MQDTLMDELLREIDGYIALIKKAVDAMSADDDSLLNELGLGRKKSGSLPRIQQSLQGWLDRMIDKRQVLQESFENLTITSDAQERPRIPGLKFFRVLHRPLDEFCWEVTIYTDEINQQYDVVFRLCKQVMKKYNMS